MSKMAEKRVSTWVIGYRAPTRISAGVLTTATRDTMIRISIVYAKKEVLMRDAAINLRALPAQRDLIDHAANLLGKNRSDFMLEAACDKAQSVVLDQVFFRSEERRVGKEC